MQKLLSIQGRKIAAAFFLSVFLLLNGIKALHVHEVDAPVPAQNKSSFSQITNCNICDLKLGNETDELSEPSTEVSIVFTEYSFPQVSSLFHADPIFISLRGPPQACIS